MFFDVRALATQMAASTPYTEKDWLLVLESARQSLKLVDIDYQSLELIALASQSPQKFTTLTRLIYQYSKSHANGEPISELILNAVNDSPFSLSDWIEAIDSFHRWLGENHRKVDFLKMFKYLQCCVISPEASEGGHTLVALVEDMLKVCGYEE